MPSQVVEFYSKFQVGEDDGDAKGIALSLAQLSELVSGACARGLVGACSPSACSPSPRRRPRPLPTAHARVPRPMGMDFQMLPASAAQPLPSSKYAKDSIKGRLSDRILNGKRKASTQAVTLSVEGRTLDRLG